MNSNALGPFTGPHKFSQILVAVGDRLTRLTGGQLPSLRREGLVASGTNASNPLPPPVPPQRRAGRIVVVTATACGVRGTELKPKRTGGSTGARGPRPAPFQLAAARSTPRMERTP